ncbi:MAG: ribose 5-phosphate isomerase B [Flavobacteriales bacterium]|nr:ribose 5-phosphate isomerase B [Flavobacteriales bacterium]
MKLAIGGDHAGYDLKEKVKIYLTEKGHEIKDFGCYSTDSVDYPDFAHPVANGVESNEFDLGILICGSGNGISMAANKHQGIRSAICWDPELASLARQHNNANILTMPARFISEDMAMEIVDAFFSQEFEGGRHQNRVEKIACV